MLDQEVGARVGKWSRSGRRYQIRSAVLSLEGGIEVMDADIVGGR